MLALKAWAVWAFVFAMAGVAALNAVSLANTLSQIWPAETSDSLISSQR